MYAHGQGVPKDYIKAYMWFSLEAAREEAQKMENFGSSFREATARNMTPAQIAEAERMTSEWQASHPVK